MKNFFYIIAVLTFVGLNAQPPAPTIECVNTITNADPTQNCMGVNAVGTWIQWANNHGCSNADFVATHVYGSGTFDGAYNFVGSATSPNQINFNDILVTNPNQVKFYYVTHECLFIGESLPSDTISNQNIPPIDLTKVTVTGGATVLEWTPVQDANAGGYIILQENSSGNFINIDTIYDPLQNSYTHYFGTPDLNAETYTIAVIDKCECWGTISNNAHTTIHLEAQPSDCNGSIILSWTPYIGWGSDLVEYKVYKDFSEIATLSPSEQSYEYVFSPGDSSIDFTVTAFKADGTNSVSNVANVVVNGDLLPAFIKVLNATVANDVVYLQYDYDLTGSADKFEINRGTNLSVLESVLNLGSNPNFNTPVADETSEPNAFSYYYRVSASDDCDTKVESTYARTMFLTGVDNFDQTITLDWNEFEIEDGVITTYTVQRMNNGTETDVATFLPGDAMTYTDNIANVDASLGFYQYRIKVEFNITDSYGNSLNLESYSNMFELAQKSRIVMPTAFRPNGVNNVFKPVIQYPNAEDYSLVIVNRWGEKIFESNQPDFGWDGTYKGDLAPQGVYAYVVKMKSFNGVDIEKKGTVLMIR